MRLWTSYLTPNDELERMITSWMEDHPGATQAEMADWLFDTFEDCQLAPRPLLLGMAKDYLGTQE